MISLRQVRTQPEDLHFLGGLHAGAEQPQVVQLPPLGRPPVKDRVGQGREMRLSQERRQHGGQQQHHQPGREYDQPGGKRDQAEGVLAEPQDRSQKPHPAGGLAAGAVEFVVKNGILERSQIQAVGMLHQADADPVGEAVAEQAVAQSIEPAEDVARDGEAQFDDHEVQMCRRLPLPREI